MSSCGTDELSIPHAVTNEEEDKKLSADEEPLPPLPTLGAAVPSAVLPQFNSLYVPKKVAAKPAAAEASSMNIRSRKQPVKKASSAKASSVKTAVVAKSGGTNRVTMTLHGRTVRRVPVPEKKAPPGMKYYGKRLVADYSEKEDQIIRDEVAKGTTQKKIAEMLSKGKEYTRSKGQVRGRISDHLGLAKKSDVVRNPIRPDTEEGKKLFPLYHVIKDMQDEGEEVNILQMCRDEGLEYNKWSWGYNCLRQWLKGKELPKALSTNERSVASRASMSKKRAATKKAAKPQELESDFY